ncbi:MAG TPA: ATP-binding protein [Gammaproteobacteria bacterium]|nr:ATP-binding protein [Gammaproteobacteria bacterium]HKH19853.1 ATP-binding protein [Gammaproteobacteria bacterium]
MAVWLATRSGRVELQIGDDGAGFDSKSLPEHGLGMLTMLERVQLIGARFYMHSKPGQDTAVSVEAPLYD